MEYSLNTFQALDPIGYLKQFTKSNVRPDSRSLHSIRPISILSKVLPKNTYGSALVRLGNTKILTAATLTIGRPSASEPYFGEIDVIVSFNPLSGRRYNIYGCYVSCDEVGLAGGTDSPKTSSAHRTFDTRVLETYVKRVILSSDIVDLHDLCIEPAKAAWKVTLSCIVLNNDGNVIDTSIISCVAALKDLTLPNTTLEDMEIGKSQVVRIVRNGKGENEKYSMTEGTTLSLKKIPVSLTIGMFQGKMLVDPTLEEESVCDGIVTIVVDAASLENSSGKHDNDGIVLNIQKNGVAMISAKELAACMQLSFSRALNVKKIII